jgi:DNA-binding SARP family transcriptional activator/WD40 repeat protein/energy-coupling factor transporter ATP-binding protein EcfA2
VGRAVVTSPARPGTGQLTFRVLGPLEVADDGRTVVVGGPKERQVLALLLANAPATVTIDVLTESLWAGRPPRSAERTVHAYIARLRKALEPGRGKGAPSSVLRTDGRGYRLDVDADRFDAARFEALARRGNEQLRTGDEEAAATLSRALDQWRGDAYAEFADVEPCAREGRRLTEIRLGAIEDRVDAELANGVRPDLVAEIERFLADHPFRERLWGQLMVALYRSGRQRDALDAYQRARSVLVDELGIEPGPELRRLEAQVLDQDPALDAPRAEPDTAHGRLPLALEAVGPAFIGRSTELDWLRSGWETATRGEGRFVSLLGPEGIGKTRLVAELARQVQALGAIVLYARCDHAHRGPRALLDQALRSGGSSLGRLDDAGAPVDELAGGFARFLATWSMGRPSLVVLDDLHLADTATLEVVADLAGWCSTQALLVVGAFRSDSGAAAGRTRDDAGDGSTQLSLSGLDRQAVGEICRLYREDGWTADDVDRLHELTGGVPLVIHEQASEWARQRTARQVSDASGRAAGARARLVRSRAEVADGVEGITRLLEQRRSQLAGRAAPAVGVDDASVLCPYKGLARFDVDDASLFFGRERLVAELVARLTASRVVAVVGPSGSGKSSLVRAGVLPALADGIATNTDRWRTIAMCPGARPSSELTTQLRLAGRSGGDERLLVFVDQFEELFTHCDREPDRTEFVQRLTGLLDDPSAALVLAVRADQLGACAAYPSLTELLTGNDVLVGPMTESELRRAIEAPAAQAGLDVEPGLVEAIVDDVAGRSGALPLLSTALAETWQRRQGRTLTLAGYQAAGGVDGAVARMAEDGYLDLGPGPQLAARRLLLRLCDASDDGVLDLRRRLPIDDVAPPDDDDARRALDLLVDRRLLTIDRDTVEIAHEALMREWPRLRGWFEDDVEGRRIHRRLGDAARSWTDSGQDRSELYRGTRLDGAVEWAATHDADLAPTERRFLDASRAEADREVEEVRRRVREKTRTNRRLGGLLAGVAVFLVLAIVAGLVAMRQRDRAERETREATARELAGESTLALDVDPELSMLLALEGIRTTRSAGEPARPEAVGALQEAVQASRLELRVDGAAWTLDASDDGEQIITGGVEPGEAVIWDAGTGERLRTLSGPLDVVEGVVLSPDASRAAVSYNAPDEDGPIPGVVVFDTATGAELSRLMGPAALYSLPSFSPDGRSVVATGRAVTVWDVATAAERFVIEPAEGAQHAIYHPDAASLIVAEPLAERVGFYSAEDGRELDALPTPGFAPEYAALDPTGDRLALSSNGSRSVQVWDLDTRALLLSFPVADTFSVDWSPDGERLAVGGGNQGPVQIVDAASGENLMVLRGHIGGSSNLAYLGDGDRLASVADDLRVWDVTPDGSPDLEAIAPQTGIPGLFQISPDGSDVLASMREGGAEFLDAHTGEPLRPPITDLMVGPFFAAASPDWQLLAVTRNDGRGQVLDMETLEPAMDIPACASPRSFSHDGSRALLDARLLCTDPFGDPPYFEPPPGADLALRLVDVASSEEVLDLSAAPEARDDPMAERSSWGGSFTPDGRYLALMIATEWVVEIHDLETGEFLTSVAPAPGQGVLSVKFDPQGRWLAGSNTGGRAWVLEMEAVVDGTSGEDAIVFDKIVHDGSSRVALNDDGVLATAGNGDGLVRLWDIESGALLTEFRTDRIDAAPVGSPWVEFSPDGEYLLYADAGGILRKYLLDTDDLVELAEQRLTRGFTAAECDRYLIPDRCEELDLA